MFPAHLWIYTTFLILLHLHHPIITTAIPSPVDNKFNFNKNSKASGAGETRTFGCDIVTLMIVVITIFNIIVYKLREAYEAKYSKKEDIYKLHDLHEAKYSKKEEMVLWPSVHICRRFSLAEILCATHNFDDKCLIGKGGSAKVYKGILGNGETTVAIKRLCFSSKQAGRSVFYTEIEMLSNFRHSHLVSLVGYCDECHEMILVFEYIPCGTLSDHLHQTSKKAYDTLSWIQRLKICIGAARGLDYLHTGTSIHQTVIHRDVKSTNILLDDNLEARVADFGISKIVEASQGCTYVSTAVRGTFGYIDPAYFTTGRLTRKSDVYALGVVLFEVLCGRKAVELSLEEEQSGLAGWAQNCIKQGRIDDIINSSLKMQISQKSLLAFVKIAYQCLNSQPSCRPTMAEIVVVLEVALASQKISDSTKVVGPYASDSGQHLTAVEVIYGKDHIKQFEINSTSRITFSRKVCQILTASVRALTVHAKNLSYSRNKNRGIDKGANLNKIGIVPQAKTFMMTENLKNFSLAELTSATRGFSPDLMLGEGYYGRVFIGWLDEDTLGPSGIGIGMAVAVKSVNQEERFRAMQAEVDLCGKFYHPNLVKLLGFCREGQAVLLVYEYIPKGNVERYAYRDSRKSLSWVVWLKILIGAARYLDFLHSLEDHIIYGDFRPSNILLDGDFNPRICNNGHARLGPQDGDTLVTSITYVAGSEGYSPPEYKEAGRLSSKNDVYAFGVVLLEILTGMRVVDVNARNMKKNLVDKARPVLGCERKVKKVVNPKLIEQKYCPKAVHSILSDVPALALKCLDVNTEKRPSMRNVLETLEKLNVIMQ